MQTTNQGFMDNDWFEMNDLKKRDYNRSVWIPLCRSEILKKEKRYGMDGHIEEYAGCFAVMFDAYLEAAVLDIDWNNVAVNSNNGPWTEGHEYFEAGQFLGPLSVDHGKYLVLEQTFDSVDMPVWNLDQDLVMALRLIREGDSWLSPIEDYVEVARLSRAARRCTTAAEESCTTGTMRKD